MKLHCENFAARVTESMWTAGIQAGHHMMS